MDPEQQVQVAQDQRSFGRDPYTQVAVLDDQLQETTRDAFGKLGRLVGVGGRAEGDQLAAPDPRQSPRRSGLRPRRSVSR